MVQGWVDEVETEVMGHLRSHKTVSLQELAAAMRISEVLALSYIMILARDGKVTIGGLGVRSN